MEAFIITCKVTLKKLKSKKEYNAKSELENTKNGYDSIKIKMILGGLSLWKFLKQ